MASRTSRTDMYARFLARKKKPPRLPSNMSATPAEDDFLFNPLVHGNRKMGSRNKGPTRRGRRY
jgi:hypothetical protein